MTTTAGRKIQVYGKKASAEGRLDPVGIAAKLGTLRRINIPS